MSGVDIAGLVEELREACVDWDGLLLPDQAEPRSTVACGEIRAAADALLAQAAELAEARRARAPKFEGEIADDAELDLWRAASAICKANGNHRDMPVCRLLARYERDTDALTRQRDEALAALKASEEREAKLIRKLASARLRPEPWQDIASAPKDGRPFEAQYDDGSTERDVYWAPERYCILGAPQGSKGPGCMSTEVGLPVDPTHWRPQGRLPALADATNDPASDPGTEQREAGR